MGKNKSKIKLFAPPEYWAIPKKIRDNWGCGPGWLGDLFIPDTLLGLSVKPACSIHDFYYRKWKDPSEEAREMADRIFKWNQIRIVINHHNKKGKFGLIFRHRIWRAEKRYQYVRKFGGLSWHNERNSTDSFVAEEYNERNIGLFSYFWR